MVRYLLLLPLILFVSVTSVQAFERRIYAGVGGGFSQLEPNTGNTGYTVEESRDSSSMLFLGWDYSPRWSLEGYYAKLGAATIEQGAGLALSPSAGDIDYEAFGVSALAYFFSFDDAEGLLARSGLSLYAGFGLASLSTDGGNLPIRQLEDLQLSLTAGAEYGTDGGMALRADVTGYDKDAVTLSLRLLYRFGGQSSRLSAPNTSQPPRQPPAQPPVQTEPQPLPAPTSIPEPLEVLPLDSDSDGVPDTADVCGETGSGVPVNETGCPLFDGRIEGVNFEPNADKLTSGAEEILDGVAARMYAYPNVKVAIMAHTDNQGSATSNLALSKRRALAVAVYLMSRGIDKARLQPEAYGESRPVASNANASGRQLNRRVEFRTIE